jgi:y4mF family transcriptional regulator
VVTHVNTSEQLGDAVRRARKQRALRLEDVALAAGVGIRFVSELERGKPTVRVAHVLRVLEALGLELTIVDPHGRP